MLDSTVESVTSALKRARAGCSAACRRRARAKRLRFPVHPPSRRWWQSSSAPSSPAMSTRWSRYSPLMSPFPCHQFPSNITAATRGPLLLHRVPPGPDL